VTRVLERDVVRALLAAFAFLTRLPVPAALSRAEDRERSIAFFPLVGVALGLILLFVAASLVGRLSPPLLAVALVALLAALTGGLHLDGLADVFDGLGGAHGDRERMLAIMRDSRIGAHGAVALVLLLLAKVVAVSTTVQHHDWRALIAFPAVARWVVVPLIVWFPSARATGLGAAFNARGSVTAMVGSTLLMIVIALWGGTRMLAAGGVALAVVWLFALWMQRRLSGLTGDVYGAAIELSEVVFLMAIAGGR